MEFFIDERELFFNMGENFSPENPEIYLKEINDKLQNDDFDYWDVFVWNFKKIDYLDYKSLNLIIGLKKKLEYSGKKMRIINYSEQVQNLFYDIKLDIMF